MRDGERYEHLRRQLAVDPLRLTEELVELPPLQQEAGEHAADATRDRDECKDAVEVAKAIAAADLRAYDAEHNLKQRSETQIDKEIMLDSNVIEALTSLREAEHAMALWRSVSDGVRTKTTSIRTIADLVQAGYTTPSSLYDKRRDEIYRARTATSRERPGR